MYIHTYIKTHTHIHTHTPFAAHLEVGYTADEISKQLIIYVVKRVLHIFPEALNIIILNVWSTNNVLKFVDPNPQKNSQHNTCMYVCRYVCIYLYHYPERLVDQ